MESRSMKIPCSRNKNITLSVIPGHFATNHSHINYYIDMTGIKYRSMIAKQAGETIAQFYEHNTSIDTSICMDAVSYTHLDVYKRQLRGSDEEIFRISCRLSSFREFSQELGSVQFLQSPENDRLPDQDREIIRRYHMARLEGLAALCLPAKDCLLYTSGRLALQIQGKSG